MHKITFLPSNEIIDANEETTILEAATKTGIKINVQCEGKGICGKCKVFLKKGEVTSLNQIGEEILSCQSIPLSDVVIEVPSQKGKIIKESAKLEGDSPIIKGICAAVDIGTTSIVVSLINTEEKIVLATEGDYNKQINLGADVLSRIFYAKEGLSELNNLVVETINELIVKLCKELDIKSEKIKYVVIAGNTTMIYLLLNKDPSIIRKNNYPQTQYNIFPASKINLNIHEDAKVFCIPGISSYVGGDIIADIIVSNLDSSDEVKLLIDIGTNGEVVLGNKDWIMACSSSAGPSFEGGEVSCGMRATEGAIEKIKIKGQDKIEFSTIGDKTPLGICGSGLIDLMAELFSNKIIDRTGNMQETFKITENLSINQNDIKNMIRSKAAIFSSCMVLIKKANMQLKDVDEIIIAGGFGNYLNIMSAIKIGLIPDIGLEKYNLIGNGAIGGAKKILMNKHLIDKSISLSKSITYIDLNIDKDFMHEYTSALFLPHTNFNLFPSIKNEI